MRAPLGALSYRNYRLYIFGQAISVIGTWLQDIGLSWLVYRLTGSAFLLGVIQFSMLIPSLLLSPFAGVWVDRLNKQRLLMITQMLSGVQAAALSILVLTGHTESWEFILLAAGLGLVAAFDNPSRQALVAEIIEDRKVLPNAIALNSFVFNFARLVGPAAAGFIIHAVGEGVCFGLNALSYIPVCIGIAMIRRPAGVPTVGSTRMWDDLTEGLSFVRSSIPIRTILINIAIASFLGGMYTVLLPVFAKNVFAGEAKLLGYLYAAVGMGALISGAMLASRKTVYGLGKIILFASLIFAGSLLAFAFSPWVWLCEILLVGVGFGLMAQMTSSNTLVQSLVEDRLRGRVMAFFTMSFMGTTPFGSLFAGWAVDLIGPRETLAISGAIGLIGAAIYWKALPSSTRLGRRVLIRRGIPPPEVLPGEPNLSEAASPAQTEAMLDRED